MMTTARHHGWRALRVVMAFATIAWAANASAGSTYPSLWDCEQAKSYWYCAEAEEPPDPPPAPGPPPPAATPRTDPAPASRTPAPGARPLNQLESLDALRKEAQARLDRASWSGAPADVQAYLEVNALMQQKSAVFADTWRRVLWTQPQFDHSTRQPTSAVALATHRTERENRRSTRLAHLAREHGLLFFYRADCPYCRAMAPILKAFASTQGFEVLAVRLDAPAAGPSSRDVPASDPAMPFASVADAGQAARLGVTMVPALFIGSRRTRETAALGFGVMTAEQIRERIYLLTSTQPGEDF